MLVRFPSLLFNPFMLRHTTHHDIITLRRETSRFVKVSVGKDIPLQSLRGEMIAQDIASTCGVQCFAAFDKQQFFSVGMNTNPAEVSPFRWISLKLRRLRLNCSSLATLCWAHRYPH